MKLGVFGGTFDPPHVGHLIVAQDAFTALGLDRLLFVPAAAPPHKHGRVSAPPTQRLAMLRAALGTDPRFAIEELELHRPGPSYTVDTLRTLRADHPDAELFFLLGADQLRELHTWRDPAEIARLARVVMLSRSGMDDGAAAVDVPCTRLAVTRVDVSATDIRRRVAAGQPIRYLVPAEVERLIAREGLYRRPDPNPGPGGGVSN